ncbi:MAG: hypothetical protein JNM30_09915 [Rhodospirillales bacterium]|nr:hypothetical protein [Rhodospirillales bacterium]
MRFRALAVAVLAIAVPAIAWSAARTERVTFPKDRPTAAIKGQIRGDSSVDYVVAAQAGQTMTITLTASNASAHFNVTAPGTRTAMFDGSVLGNEFKAKLPLSGDYVVQLYLSPDAVKRKASANYTLAISTSPLKP